MKAIIGRREYTTEVHKQETAKSIDYAKALENGLASSTFKAYARDVISRAAAQDRRVEPGTTASRSVGMGG